jgi:hypothetical protein
MLDSIFVDIMLGAVCIFVIGLLIFMGLLLYKLAEDLWKEGV